MKTIMTRIGAGKRQLKPHLSLPTPFRNLAWRSKARKVEAKEVGIQGKDSLDSAGRADHKIAWPPNATSKVKVRGTKAENEAQIAKERGPKEVDDGEKARIL